jgi:hypothetical protein
MSYLRMQNFKAYSVLLATLLGTTNVAVAAISTVPTPCDKELSVSDASGILKGTPAINRYSMGASAPGEGCELGVGDGNPGIAMIDIAVKGHAANYISLMRQTSAKPPRQLKGVGDEAFDRGSSDSNIPDATEIEVYARKGDWICIASLHRTNGAPGEKLLVTTEAAAIADRLGDLCQKIFVARRY